MFLNASGDSENIRIENYVRRIEANLVNQNLVRALADSHFALDRVRLPVLIECHDDDGGAVGAHELCLLDKCLFAFFEADRINNRLALDALQPGFDDRPFRGIDHEGQARDVGLSRDQVEESHHRLLGVEHPLIHIHIDDLRAVVDLVASNLNCGSVVVCFDQASKYRGASDVASLADIDEQIIWPDIQRFEP